MYNSGPCCVDVQGMERWREKRDEMNFSERLVFQSEGGSKSCFNWMTTPINFERMIFQSKDLYKVHKFKFQGIQFQSEDFKKSGNFTEEIIFHSEDKRSHKFL